MSVDWYAQGPSGDNIGPLTNKQLTRMIQGGELSVGTLVWNQEMTEWKPFSQLSYQERSAGIADEDPESDATAASLDKDGKTSDWEPSINVYRLRVVPAILAGLVTAVISAYAWAKISVAMEFQIGWMAIFVGLFVGLAVRIAGGIGQVLGFIGAGFAFLGCALGNLWTVILFFGAAMDLPDWEAIRNFDYAESLEYMKAMFSPMDVLFYGLAIYQGWKIATYGSED